MIFPLPKLLESKIMRNHVLNFLRSERTVIGKLLSPSLLSFSRTFPQKNPKTERMEMDGSKYSSSSPIQNSLKDRLEFFPHRHSHHGPNDRSGKACNWSGHSSNGSSFKSSFMNYLSLLSPQFNSSSNKKK